VKLISYLKFVPIDSYVLWRLVT